MLKAKAECSVGRVVAVAEGMSSTLNPAPQVSARSLIPKSSWIDFFLKPFPMRMKQWCGFKILSKDFSGKKFKKSLLSKRTLGEKMLSKPGEEALRHSLLKEKSGLGVPGRGVKEINWASSHRMKVSRRGCSVTSCLQAGFCSSQLWG